MIGAPPELAPATPSVSFSGRAMASPLTFTIAAAPGSEDGFRAADAAWAAIVDEFGRCEDAMSRFRDSSEVTRLNRLLGRAAVGVGRRLRHALVVTDRARRVTGGRFEPRVVGALEEIGYRGASLPIPATIATGRVVEVDPLARTVCLATPVDLGGIGKGLALRWAAGRVERVVAGCGFLLDAGGDIVGRGPAPDGSAWRIGIEDPRRPTDDDGSPLAVVELSTGAIATSSVRRNRWRTADARDVHHLIDPMTGRPASTGILAVTVAHADPAWAEVWAKALFICGAARIGSEARSLGLAAWWVEEDGTLSMTPAARMRTIWTAPVGRTGPVGTLPG